MNISIIILNYNVKYFTDACLQSVLRAVKDTDTEIIVVDNHSTDGSSAYFKGRYPQVTFLWLDQNYGFGKAYNKAVAQAKGEYLLFLNPDTLISDDLLTQFKNFAVQHSDFGIIGGQMIDGTGHFLPESKRGIPTPLVAFNKLTQLYKILNFKPFNAYYASHISQNQTGVVPILTGALMFMRKANFEAIGGFDERFFMYGEDIDLSYRMLQSGRKNYYLPTAQIIHFKGESSHKNPAYYRHFLETTFQFYRKHFRYFPPLEFLMRQFFKIWLSLRLKRHKAEHKSIVFQMSYFIGKPDNYKILQSRFSNLQAIKQVTEIRLKSARLIFDADALTFSEIIEMMTTLKDQGISFRFYFPSQQMLVGSDYKDALGKVVLIDI